MTLKLITFVTASLLASPAFSHATLEQKSAPMNANYKAVMRVPHGCDGAATTQVRIVIPEGVINAKPMPKAGWELETVRGDYAKTYEYHGPRSEGVKEIIWTGKLEADHYDEFVFRARVTDAFEAGSTIYFPTTQICTEGQNPWVEIPAEGQTRRDLDKPAPELKLEAAKAHKH